MKKKGQILSRNGIVMLSVMALSVVMFMQVSCSGNTQDKQEKATVEVQEEEIVLDTTWLNEEHTKYQTNAGDYFSKCFDSILREKIGSLPETDSAIEGIYLVTIRTNGTIKDVVTTESCGYENIDKAAIESYQEMPEKYCKLYYGDSLAEEFPHGEFIDFKAIFNKK